MFSILVVEDNEPLNKLICAKLKQEYFHTVSAYSGHEALELMDATHIDLMICDLMMPGMDGFELVRTLRDARCKLPILIVTAKDQIEDMETAFRAGTDDYLVKPFNMKEMILRVNALLRRAQIANEKKLTVGEFLLDYHTLTVHYKNEEMILPAKEFYLLFLLLSNQGKIFTRLELLDQIWGMDTRVDERTVDAYIKKVRRKFETYEDFSILTIRGLGYMAKGKE